MALTTTQRLRLGVVRLIFGKSYASFMESQLLRLHPELEHRVHVSSTRQGRAEIVADDYLAYAQVYAQHTWVKVAVTKIAEAIAPLDVRVVAADGEVLPAHILSDFLTHGGNPHESVAQIWEAWVVDRLLGGEAFLEIVSDGTGRPLEFWRREPQVVGVRIDNSRPLYPRVSGYVLGDDDQLIPPDTYWHSKFHNPLNPWRGLAPITAVRQGIVIDIFAQTWSKNFLRNGARPDFAIVAPEGLTETERNAYLRDFMVEYGGYDNTHRPLILEDGVTDVKILNFAPKDVEWLKQREFSRDEIMSLFGVPDEIAGYGRNTYENFETALRVFWLQTLVPLVGARDRSLTHFFTRVRPMLSDGQKIRTDLSEIGVLQEDLTPAIQNARRLWGMGVPFNVINDRLNLGIGDIEGGDVGYVQAVATGEARQASVSEETGADSAVSGGSSDE
jgi:HK97 family phage portal protein